MMRALQYTRFVYGYVAIVCVLLHVFLFLAFGHGRLSLDEVKTLDVW